MSSKVKKVLCESLDSKLKEIGCHSELKLFGSPVSDFDFKSLSNSEFQQIRELLRSKINKYASSIL